MTATQGTGERGIVGRQREIDELRRGLDEAIGGRTRLFLLTGDPGIGKTRLASAVADEAERRGASAVWGRCWEAGGAPAYWPWVQVLRAIARRAGEALPSLLGAGAPHLAQLDPSLGASPGELPMLDPEQARFQMFDAVAGFLARSAEKSPLALVLDDLHVADVPSLLLLQFVTRTLNDARIAIVGTHREAASGVSSDVASLLGDIGREARTFRLGGLELDEVGSLIATTAGGAASPGVVGRVYALTEGNPFFVDEIARLLAADGNLGDDVAPVSIPEGVRDTVAKRLARLPAETRALLATASVAGREFAVDLLQHVVEQPRAALIEQLAPAEESRLVAAHLGRHAFSHAIVRETLYASIPATERARIHRRIAEALERAGGASEDIAEIAHHWFAAARSGDAGPAAEYMERAGRRALSMLAFEDAAAHYERALEALAFEAEPDEQRRCDVLLLLGDAQRCAGRLSAARATFTRAAASAKTVGDGALLARATLGIGAIHSGGVWARAWTSDGELVALAEEAVAMIGPDDSIVRARLLARLGADFLFSPRRVEGIELASEAVRIAERIGDADTLAFCLTAKHNAIWAPDTTDERLALVTQAVKLAGQAGNRELAMTAHAWRQTDLLELGRFAEAEAEADAYLRFAAESRRPQYGAYADMVLAARLRFQGRVSESIALSKRAYDYGIEAGEDIIANSAVVQMTQAQILTDPAEAFRTMSLHTLRTAAFVAVLSKAAALSGDLAGARGLVASVVAETGFEIEWDAFWSTSVPDLAVACVVLGDVARARVLLEAMKPFASLNVIGGRNGVHRLGPMTTFLAALSTTIGDFDAADGYAQLAVARAEASGSPVWLAEALIEHARLLTRRAAAGDRGTAVAVLDRVAGIARAHGLPEIERVADTMRPAAPGAATGEAAASLIREGEYWTAGYGSEIARLKHTRGLEHLAALLAQPNREIHAVELTSGPDAVVSGDAGPVLDEEAKSAYRKRLLEAQAELEEAEDFNDPERAARVKAEIDAITRELSAAVGLGGRNRAMDSAAERARIAVTKSLKTAIDRIGKALPPLGEHLAASIKTGTFCSYAPAPGSAPGWML